MEPYYIYWGIIALIVCTGLLLANIDIYRNSRRELREKREALAALERQRRFNDMCRQINIDTKADIRKKGA